jgi:hypothetical protein
MGQWLLRADMNLTLRSLCHQHIWRDHVLKTLGLALLLASGLAIAGAPVRALRSSGYSKQGCPAVKPEPQPVETTPIA